MTHITVSSETRLTSQNGDGPVALENAATLYAALSALGAVPIVEIVIRTQPEGACTTPARIAEPAADSGAFLVAANPPFSAPNPTTPPLREAGTETVRWLGLTRDERVAAIHEQGRKLTKQLGRPLKYSDWDRFRPEGFPAAAGVALVYAPDKRWAVLAQSWLQSAT